MTTPELIPAELITEEEISNVVSLEEFRGNAVRRSGEIAVKNSSSEQVIDTSDRHRTQQFGERVLQAIRKFGGRYV